MGFLLPPNKYLEYRILDFFVIMMNWDLAVIVIVECICNKWQYNWKEFGVKWCYDFVCVRAGACVRVS
jgi:hypothetical protein